MFEQLEDKKWLPSPRAAFAGAIFGTFTLGIGVGKLIAGVTPWDWTSRVLDFGLLAFYTCWFGVAVVRALPKRV